VMDATTTLYTVGYISAYTLAAVAIAVATLMLRLYRRTKVSPRE
jgi:hypothetical protein